MQQDHRHRLQGEFGGEKLAYWPIDVTEIICGNVLLTLFLFLNCRICRTKTNIGTKRVSYVTNVESVSLISNSDPRRTKSTAATAMTRNSLPDATAVAKFSEPVSGPYTLLTFDVALSTSSEHREKLKPYLVMGSRFSAQIQ